MAIDRHVASLLAMTRSSYVMRCAFYVKEKYKRKDCGHIMAIDATFASSSRYKKKKKLLVMTDRCTSDCVIITFLSQKYNKLGTKYIL